MRPNLLSMYEGMVLGVPTKENHTLLKYVMNIV